MIKKEKSRGIISVFPAEQLKLTRYHCSPALSVYIEHFWQVEWTLEGKAPFISENLPHPSSHLVFDRNGAEVTGVIKGKFRRHLEGNGEVFAVKFLAGAFYPFMRAPLSGICNRIVHPETIFTNGFHACEKAVWETSDAEKRIEVIEKFLLDQHPVYDETIPLIRSLVDRVISDRMITRVEQLAELGGMNLRRLQRIFRLYVGVAPKWIIQRYRLIEAVECLKAGEAGSLAGLATSLGYADQAHFIRDFKSIVGESPAEYLKKVSAHQ